MSTAISAGNAPIDLADYFRAIEGERYTLIKIPKAFPNLSSKSDLDIFCYDLENICSKLFSVAYAKFQSDDSDCHILRISDQHWQLDLKRNKNLLLKFDLFGAMPTYKRICLKESFFESVIENSKSVPYGFNGEKIEIQLPSIQDDIIIRYVEYAEYYWCGPDKIHHLDHVFSLLRDDLDLRRLVFEKLHHYTSFRRAEDRAQQAVQSSRKLNPVLRFWKRIRKKSFLFRLKRLANIR